QPRGLPEEPALESPWAFWAEAGVDTLYADEPVNRLAEPIRPARAQPQAPVAAPTPLRTPKAPGADVSAAIAQAQELAAAAEDLAALEAAIAAFDGCGLKFEGARRAV